MSSSGPSPLPDAALVEAARLGDTSAFAALIVRYQRAACAAAYSAVGRFEPSEDVAQEAFVTAWRSLSTLKDPARFRPWLCGIARNLGHAARRRRESDPLVVAVPCEAVDDVVAAEGSTLDRALEAEDEAALWRALAQVPDTYREPLVLYYREGRSVEAAAAALEISKDALHQRLHRARELLKAELRDFVERGLERSGPSKSFAATVLAALGAAVATPASAAAAVGSAAVVGKTVASGVLVWGAIAAAVALAGGGIAVIATRASAARPSPTEPPVRVAEPGGQAKPGRTDRPARAAPVVIAPAATGTPSPGRAISARPAPPPKLVAPVTGPVPAPLGDPRAEPTPDERQRFKDELRAVMRETVIPAVRECLGRLPPAARGEGGRMNVRMNIHGRDGLGRVEEASLVESSGQADAGAEPPSPLVQQCLIGALADVPFPNPIGGQSIVTYPIQISF